MRGGAPHPLPSTRGCHGPSALFCLNTAAMFEFSGLLKQAADLSRGLCPPRHRPAHLTSLDWWSQTLSLRHSGSICFQGKDAFNICPMMLNWVCVAVSDAIMGGYQTIAGLIKAARLRTPSEPVPLTQDQDFWSGFFFCCRRCLKMPSVV